MTNPWHDAKPVASGRYEDIRVGVKVATNLVLAHAAQELSPETYPASASISALLKPIT